jgi:uncharacterized protein YjbJ (UPF0337 family)
MALNSEKVEGTVNTAVGTVKENLGKATGDRDMEAEGGFQKVKGHIHKLCGAVKESAGEFKALFGNKPKMK